MSKRYGRNQRRRSREEIASLKAEALRLSTMLFGRPSPTDGLPRLDNLYAARRVISATEEDRRAEYEIELEIFYDDDSSKLLYEVFKSKLFAYEGRVFLVKDLRVPQAIMSNQYTTFDVSGTALTIK